MRGKRLLIGYINIANAITLIGMLLSLSSGFFALSGNIKLSIIFLIFAGICDLFDGVVARKIKRTDDEKKYGALLDTTVDTVSFGVVPAVIVLSAYWSAWYARVICAYYMICTVTRLSYFGATSDTNTDIKHYHGLPVTYISLILPVVMIFGSAIASVLTLLLVGTLFILNIKVPKPRGIWYAVFPVLAIVLSVLWWLS